MSNKNTSTPNSCKSINSDFSDESIPDNVIDKANEYIIGNVGREHFEKNYVFTENHSGVGPGATAYDPECGEFPLWLRYSLAYEYIPLTKLVSKPSFVRVSIRKDVDGKPSGFVGCGSDCLPIVSKDDALSIASKNGFDRNQNSMSISLGPPNLSFFKGYTGPDSPIRIKGWVWKITIPIESGSECWGDINLYIDAANGTFYNTGESLVCM